MDGERKRLDAGPGAKAEILKRVRAAIGGSSEEARLDWDAITREYRRTASRSREAILDLLEDRLRDYDAQVVRCGSHGGCPGIAPEWLPAEVQFVRDEGFLAMDLDEVMGVMTGSTVAIAETGTIVLQNVPGQGRRAATLVPDYHLCVVIAEDVVETVTEAIARLAGTTTLATTFVSGPSATADIEMTRIKGVHGPRHLDVILVV